MVLFFGEFFVFCQVFILCLKDDHDITNLIVVHDLLHVPTRTTCLFSAFSHRTYLHQGSAEPFCGSAMSNTTLQDPIHNMVGELFSAAC